MTVLPLSVRLPDWVGRSPATYGQQTITPGEVWRVPHRGRTLLYYIVGARRGSAWMIDVVRLDARGGNRWSCISAPWILMGTRVREAGAA